MLPTPIRFLVPRWLYPWAYILGLGVGSIVLPFVIRAMSAEQRTERENPCAWPWTLEEVERAQQAFICAEAVGRDGEKAACEAVGFFRAVAREGE